MTAIAVGIETSPTYISFQDVLAEDLKEDPAFADEWESTKLAREVAAWVILYRTRHGLSQRQLAELLGWSQPTVTKIEMGEQNPRMERLLFLSKTLGVEFHIHIGPQTRVEVSFDRDQEIAPADVHSAHERS